MNSLIDVSYDLQPDEPAGRDPGSLGDNLRKIWAGLYRNRLIVSAAILLCVLLSILYLVLATPVYRASASVQIEEQSTRVLKSNDLEPVRNPMDSERFLQTQLDIIRSRSVALAVAKDQKLFGNAQFLKSMNVSEDLGEPGVLTPRQAEEERLLRILKENMEVKLPVDSRIATISFSSPDPQLAARMANSFAESYIRTDLQRKYDTSAYAREFIGNQLDDAKQQLERSERAALAYASRERLIDASNGARSDATSAAPKSLTVSRLVASNSAYAEAVAKRTQAEQKWRQAQGSAIMALPEVLQNQAIQDLLQKRAVVVAAYEEQRQTRKDDFPTVRQAKAQVVELNRQISTLAGLIRASLQSEYNTARGQEAAFRQQISTLESATLNEQQRNVQLSILQRATDTSRSLYDSLLQRFRELSAEAGVQPNNIQLIDRADVPSQPVSPRLLLTLAMGLLGGLVAGVAAAFVTEHLNDTVRSSDDIATKIDIPFLGMVPEIKTGQVRTELQDLKSPVSEAYSSIRASLLMSSRTGLPKSLAFTSVQPGEGKTTSCFATATGLARIGKRVVVVDCDLRRPALHKAFDVKNRVGISEYLSGQTQLSNIIQKGALENVSIISCGAIPPNPTELLSGPLFAEMLERLSEQFDTVIVDAPPLLGLADAPLIGSQVGAVVLIMESGRNYHGGLRASVNRLRKVGSRVIGAILTKQNPRNLGYAYDAKYSYTYGHDQAA